MKTTISAIRGHIPQLQSGARKQPTGSNGGRKAGAPLIFVPSSRPSSDRGSTFHFAHKTISKGSHPAYKNRSLTPAVQHQGYIERQSALEASDSAKANEIRATIKEKMHGIDSAAKTGALGLESRTDHSHSTPQLHKGFSYPDIEIEKSFSSFGTIGKNRLERKKFWRLLEDHERSNARVQNRIIAELPFELTADERLALALEFCEIFHEMKLPYWAAIHAPDKRNDSRNFHIHISYSERPAGKNTSGEWDFSIRKSRRYNSNRCYRTVRPFACPKPQEIRSRSWIPSLRERYASVSNVFLKQLGYEKRLDPRPYWRSGIPKQPTRHLGGATHSRLLHGLPSQAGEANSLSEIRFRLHEKEKPIMDRVASFVSALYFFKDDAGQETEMYPYYIMTHSFREAFRKKKNIRYLKSVIQKHASNSFRNHADHFFNHAENALKEARKAYSLEIATLYANSFIKKYRDNKDAFSAEKSDALSNPEFSLSTVGSSDTFRVAHWDSTKPSTSDVIAQEIQIAQTSMKISLQSMNEHVRILDHILSNFHNDAPLTREDKSDDLASAGWDDVAFIKPMENHNDRKDENSFARHLRKPFERTEPQETNADLKDFKPDSKKNAPPRKSDTHVSDATEDVHMLLALAAITGDECIADLSQKNINDFSIRLDEKDFPLAVLPAVGSEKNASSSTESAVKRMGKISNSEILQSYIATKEAYQISRFNEENSEMHQRAKLGISLLKAEAGRRNIDIDQILEEEMEIYRKRFRQKGERTK